jgi:hypothetical protein
MAEPREWQLPSGTKWRFNQGSIEVMWPRTDKWILVVASQEHAEDLLAVMQVEVMRGRKTGA